MKKSSSFGLSILSGLLLWAAWPVSPLTFLVFVAFVPLLQLADKVEHRRFFFLLTFITILTWNACTTWWIWNSTGPGAVAAIIANSLIMCLPWWGYRVFKRKFGRRIGYASLVIFWMTFEYIHLNWQLSWPWLTLGNVFASNPYWVQWYEFTGASGGTLWVLLANILLFEAWSEGKSRQFKPAVLIYPLAVIILPLLISFLMIPARTPDSKDTNVVIVQPNIDPYGKFAAGEAGPQVQLLLSLTQSVIDSNTRLVVWPETALTRPWSFEGQTRQYPEYQPIYMFAQQHPNTTFETGIEILKNYGPQKATRTAVNIRGAYIDDFNAAIAIKAGTQDEYYHKSRLVPGVETLPSFLDWMAPVFEQFGGTTGGYGKQDSSSIFQQPGQPYITAPIICYESIYGEYVGTYVQKGANLLTVITNDGWWGNTPGHKQHLAYARLRAIETRKWVARSANTGISAVIDNRGDVITSQPWDKEAVIKYNIPVSATETFYVKHGDILSKATLVLGCLFFGWNIIVIIRKRLAR